jgi:methylthioribose-1-phosphate isomerase
VWKSNYSLSQDGKIQIGEIMERYDGGLAFILQYENVAWFMNDHVQILDRRIYPIKIEYVNCYRYQEVVQAIKDMVTQSGGPFMAASMGMVLAVYQYRDLPDEELLEVLITAATALGNARPTTASKMNEYTQSCLVAAQKAMAAHLNVLEAVWQQALHDHNQRYQTYQKVGKYLAEVTPNHSGVLTQCWGETVVGMYLLALKQQNKDIKLYCPETRPYLQGARLTASCAYDMGFDVTVITDNMVAALMADRKIDLFFSATDVITQNGYVINKVGTLQYAISANYYKIPYFACGVFSQQHKTQTGIQIEYRNSEDVLHINHLRSVLAGVKGLYPAFDITPPQLVYAYLTPNGPIFPYELIQEPEQ